MFESIFETVVSDAGFTVQNLLLTMVVSLALGLLISVVYIFTNKTKIPSKSFAITLVVLPVIVTLIILLVGNSVARAFSLAGAFQIIRFRSTPGDPKNITYVLFSMAVGLCCGMGYLIYGVIAAAVLCLVVIILEAIDFGSTKSSPKLLKIAIPESLNYAHAFDEIMQMYTLSHKLIKVNTADLGSLYELHYRIVTSDDVDEKAFIDELRVRNGNLNISLVLDAPQSDF
ncbi:MAG: DUF4956 domain-containing protein [Clostridiales Family XIII bacterium]|jgi:hypothetical protein|nr:DUF4956 domain-containing protein [Clostridiales Family XIII bacterium]